MSLQCPQTLPSPVLTVPTPPLAYKPAVAGQFQQTYLLCTHVERHKGKCIVPYVLTVSSPGRIIDLCCKPAKKSPANPPSGGGRRNIPSGPALLNALNDFKVHLILSIVTTELAVRQSSLVAERHRSCSCTQEPAQSQGNALSKSISKYPAHCTSADHAVVSVT